MASRGAVTPGVATDEAQHDPWWSQAAYSPDAVGIKRLIKLKAKQEQRLQTMRTRVDRLAVQEQRLWKDVTSIQRVSSKMQDTQLRKRNLQTEQRRAERELLTREQLLRRQAEEHRYLQAAARVSPNQVTWQDNQAAAQKLRQDSNRLLSALQQVRETTQQNKQMQVDLRRHQRRQRRLRMELEQGQRQELRQAKLATEYAQLQNELTAVEQAVAEVEKQEVNAALSLQNSQSMRAYAVASLQSAKAFFDDEPQAQDAVFKDELENRFHLISPHPWVNLGLKQIAEEEEDESSLCSTVAEAVAESMRDIGLEEFRKQLGLQEFRRESSLQAPQSAHGSECGDRQWRRYRSVSPPQKDSKRNGICGSPQPYRTCFGSPRLDCRRVLGPSNGIFTSARAFVGQ